MEYSGTKLTRRRCFGGALDNAFHYYSTNYRVERVSPLMSPSISCLASALVGCSIVSLGGSLRHADCEQNITIYRYNFTHVHIHCSHHTRCNHHCIHFRSDSYVAHVRSTPETAVVYRYCTSRLRDRSRLTLRNNVAWVRQTKMNVGRGRVYNIFFPEVSWPGWIKQLVSWVREYVRMNSRRI